MPLSAGFHCSPFARGQKPDRLDAESWRRELLHIRRDRTGDHPRRILGSWRESPSIVMPPYRLLVIGTCKDANDAYRRVPEPFERLADVVGQVVLEVRSCVTIR